MFHYVEDKEFLHRMKAICSDIVNRLVQTINREDFMTVRAHLVGSGAKNLILQNENEAVDLDYNLEVMEGVQRDFNNATKIKEYIRKKFNKILQASGWSDCSDSTSCLSTKKMQFKKGNKTEFSIDLAIVHKNPDGTWYRLIHRKTGFIATDSWIWNEAPNSKGLSEKADWIKKNANWLDVRKSYKRKKNMYLARNDHNHPSFVCYIEAVNEVYQNAKFHLG